MQSRNKDSPDRSIHDAVQRTYARAKAPTKGVQLAGYTNEQLASVPEGVSFFGCGNPLAYADVTSGATVLDLGSGAGLDLILAGKTVGPTGHVIGVDMTESMIERARINIARASLSNVELRKGKIEALPVESASIDWVISNCVLSLSPDKARVFSEIARVLRPGGRMLISDIVVDAPMAWILGRLVRLAPSIAMARTEQHYFDAMTRAGLEDIEVLDRLVYEPTDLIGLFGGEFGADTASCPLHGVRAAARRTGQHAMRLGARAAAGHVWSSKMRARRPC